MTIYAWVGEDENGSGRIGLKQGLCPAGYIPLACMSYDLHKLARMKPQMEEQAKKSGMKIRLCRFDLADIAAETKAGTWGGT